MFKKSIIVFLFMIMIEEERERREIVLNQQLERDLLYCIRSSEYHQLHRTEKIGSGLNPEPETRMVWIEDSGPIRSYTCHEKDPTFSILKGRKTKLREKVNGNIHHSVKKGLIIPGTDYSSSHLTTRVVTISRSVSYRVMGIDPNDMLRQRLLHWRRIDNRRPLNLSQLKLLQLEFGKDSTYQENWVEAQICRETENYQSNLAVSTGFDVDSCSDSNDDQTGKWLDPEVYLGVGVDIDVKDCEVQ